MIHQLEAIFCHGSENFFYLINSLEKEPGWPEEEYTVFVKNLIKKQQPFLRIDGVLFLLPGQNADARMRIFNKDGSEADMCGNGFRCLAKKFAQISGKTSFSIETRKHIYKGFVEEEIYPDIDAYSVLLKPITFDYNGKVYRRETIPDLSEHLLFSSINTGNPQLIAKIDAFDEIELFKLGKKINNNCTVFPQGNNISFYRVIGKQKLFVSTYERGVGLTNSCGTAMAGVSLVAAQLGEVKFNQWVSIHNKGGMVKCLPQNINNELSVKLLGNATFLNKEIIVYDTKWHHVDQIKNVESYPQEGVRYYNFKDAVKYIQ